jgi:carbon dioxide concentrating mechanism protein CcmN
MSLSHLDPVTDQNVYINGNVTIHPSAAIAPGAILQTTANGRIVIGEGACLGMGVILNAYQGSISIEAGAILGEKVLMVGEGKIGANACIGAATTIFNTSVAAKTVVSAHSLLGDQSRQIKPVTEVPQSSSEKAETPEIEDFWETEPEVEPEVELKVEPEVEPEVELKVERMSPNPQSNNNPVVGQVYINQLLFTLFPERRSQGFSG